MTFILDIENVGMVEVDTLEQAIVARRNAAYMGYTANIRLVSSPERGGRQPPERRAT